jgi:hypothetical protein
MNQPSIQTHIPMIASTLPEEPKELAEGRPDFPTPSLWQERVQVVHKRTNRRAVVVRIDRGTNQFRAFYPDEGEVGADGKPVGVYSTRTDWQNFADWDVQVTFSPKELERQAALAKLENELDAINKVDPEAFAWIQVLIDDGDPKKALAKLEAMRRGGFIKEAAHAALSETKKGGK